MRRHLRKYSRRIDFQAGDHVFHQGEPPDGAYFLARGRVDVLIDLHGTERKLRIQSLTSGAIFGELGLIDARPRSATIVATQPTTCYWMDTASFERLRREQPGVTVSLISDIALIFAERLRANAAMLAEMEK
jgi:SulP family sulfate permease